MSKPPEKPVPTKQSLALTAAILAADVTKAAVAEHMEVSPGLVSQWASGYRPVPADKARRLAAFLNVNDPGRLSTGYAAVRLAEGGDLAPDAGGEIRPDLAIARLENDADAMQMVLAALVSAMTIHRPTEAAAVARTLRKTVPAKFRHDGLVAQLLEALDRAPRVQIVAPADASAPAKPRSARPK